MLSLRQCCKWQSRPEITLLGGRQAGHKRKEEEQAHLCLFCVLFQTHPSEHSSTFQVDEVTRGPRETGSVTADKLPAPGRRHWEWEVLPLRSFSFVRVKCFPHFPPLSYPLACSSILPSTWGTNQVLLLFLSSPNGFHFIPGWFSLEPKMRSLVGLSSSAVDLRTRGEPTWEAHMGSRRREPLPCKLWPQANSLRHFITLSIPHGRLVMLLTPLCYRGMNWILETLKKLPSIP